MSGHTH